MVFNSLHFIIYFIIVTSLYFVLPHNKRWFLLLLSSCYFYMAFVPIYILILAFTIVIDYIAGRMIENAEGKRRKMFLIFSLIANIGVLSVFKYYNFINLNFSALLNDIGWNNPLPNLSILLPIGLSFHTFQAMSYTIEVYRGHQKAEKHFGIYSLYVMFYPQLVAGPIERPQNLLHQFREKHNFDYQRIVDGLKLMLWGFFKKVVIADRLAIAVNQIYSNPQDYQGIHFILVTFFFTIQVYCDFSAYSDIAIGAAKVMGISLMKNFRRPFFASSIAELWQRWHISLTSWFKDYVYIPLGGNRVSKYRWYLNLFIVFLISGLWHGANWTYIAFGAFHGFYLTFAIITSSFRNKISDMFGFNKFTRLTKIRKIIITFSLFAFSLCLFRSKDFAEFYYISTHFFDGMGTFLMNLGNSSYWRSLFSAFGMPESELYIAFATIIILFIVEFFQEKNNILEIIKSKPLIVRWSLYYAIIIGILFFGAYNSGQQFIYFQF